MEDIKRSKVKTRLLRKSVVLSAAISALAGCDSGHTVTPVEIIASPGGLFGANLGTASSQIVLIAENGQGWLYDNAAKLSFSLSLDIAHEVLMSNGVLALSGTIVEYDETSGAVINSGTLQANVLTHYSVVLTYSISSGPSSSYTLAYRPNGAAGYAQISSLAAIAGSYQPVPDSDAGATQINSLTIDSSGNLSGTDAAGCTYLGSVAIIDTNYNAYQLNNVTETCGTAQTTLTGEALVAAKTSSSSQQVILSLYNSAQQSAVGIVALTN